MAYERSDVRTGDACDVSESTESCSYGVHGSARISAEHWLRPENLAEHAALLIVGVLDIVQKHHIVHLIDS